ncbi:MAG: hypothetical protein M3O01_04025 [Pseudomonadota bacterium]|nr:hypothetical protein [Pseudomonadota bacterium]
MVVFSWVMFGLSVLLAVSSLGAFLLFIFLDIPAWLERARSLRRGLYMALLLWFNVWVWGRVIMALIHW